MTPEGREPAEHSVDAEHSVAKLLESLHDQLKRVEQMVEPEVAAAKGVERQMVPAWRRATDGEHRLPVAAAVALAIALQLVLPKHLAIRPTWLLPSLEGLLLVGLIVANPRRINRTSTTLRAASVSLIALISLANAWSSAELAPPDWTPNFIDYLYVSFTNASAFSPTDTMPLSPMAKMLMLAQSLISLVTIGLVVARAVNILA